MEIQDLPEGWQFVSLGQILDIQYGKGLPKRLREESGSIAVYGSNGVVGQHTAAITKGPTIIIGRKGSVGEVHFCPVPCWPIDTTFYIDQFPDGLDPQYLNLFLKSQHLQRLNIHAAIPGIRRDDLYRVGVPLPYPDDPIRSLETQRRIVARIEALFAELAEARRLHDAIRQDTEAVMEAVLAEVFPHPEDELPEGWEVKAVAEISEKPQYGYTQSARWEPVGPKFLRITDIQNGQVNWETVPYCECDDATLGKFRLEQGELVFARSGATTGKTFLVGECPEAVFASYLIRLRVCRDAFPKYVYWFFQSPYYWDQIKPRGAAQPNMNARILSRLKVPIPRDKNTQRRIVAYLDAVQAHITTLRQAQEAAAAELERLEQAILARAFRGEL